MAALRLAVAGMLAMLLFAGSANAALLPASDPPAQEEAAPAPMQAIEADTDPGADARIARRIEGVFASIAGLSDVTVTVREGVVTLGGLVLDPADIDRAESIASRVKGVVTVENAIERDLSLEESFGALGALTDKLSGIVKLLPLIGAALLVAVGFALLGYALASLGFVWRKIAPNRFLADLIATAVRFVFVIGGLVVALDMIGAGALLGAVLGGAGILGIALGFAMRDTIENYVASILLSVRQPFRANDWVVIDSYEGRVIRLTSRATILMTLDGNHLRIPNGQVFKAVILNYTRNPQRRFQFDLGIDAEDDPTAARQLGTKTLTELDFILDEPAPGARVTDVGDSNIVLTFLAWVDQNQVDWYQARSAAIPAVKDALEQAGFALPEPIYRLRFDSAAPLPLHDVGAAGQGEVEVSERSQSATARVVHEADQVAPEGQVVDMVERERKQTGVAEKDLLDPERPVE